MQDTADVHRVGLTKAFLSDLTHVTIHVCLSRMKVNAYMVKYNERYLTP